MTAMESGGIQLIGWLVIPVEHGIPLKITEGYWYVYSKKMVDAGEKFV